MAQRNAIPRLVVKIVAGKQVKQFIEEPPEDTETEKEDPVSESSDDDLEKRGVMDSAVWAAINQVGDRVCVTAPSGDRSRSYIHTKTSNMAAEPPSAGGGAETPEQKGASEDTDKAELSAAVRDELSDWQLSSLASTEDAVAALDPTSGGTLDRWQITQLFLKNDAPLKLPTLSLLLQMFSDGSEPGQIHYRKLLQFIRSSAFPEERRQ